MSTKTTTIRRAAFFAVAIASLGVIGAYASGDAKTSPEVAPAMNEGSSVQSANLLVPRRTRLVIRFERTAIC